MKNVIKKFLTVFLIAAMLIPTSVPMQAKAASLDYKNWLQMEGPWADVHLGSSSYTMRSSGCLVTTIAMLMCHSGSADASNFSPLTLVNYLNNNGGFTSQGALYWDRVNGCLSSFKLKDWKVPLTNSDGSAMTRSQKVKAMANYIEQGYAVVIMVRNGGHWVALDRVEGDKVYMIDPGTKATDLFAQYDESGVTRLALFKGARKCGTVTGTVSITPDEDENSMPSGTTGTVNCSALNVRSGAGTNYSIVKCISNGQSVNVLAETKDSYGTKWYKISVSGATGYVAAQYITLGEIAPQNQEEDDSEPGLIALSRAGLVNCTSLNIRKSATTSASVVKTVKKNTAVQVSGKLTDAGGNKWYKVTCTAGVCGYVSAPYITLCAANVKTVKYLNAKGYTDGTAVKLYNSMSTGSSVTGKYGRGRAITIIKSFTLKNGAAWSRVRVAGKYGYMRTAYIKQGTYDAKLNTFPAGTTVRSYSVTNIRSGAGLSYSVKGSVPAGGSMTVWDFKKDSSGMLWYNVKRKDTGLRGWIRSDCVRK